jgi:2-oxoisovalerate dehydrogenase E1 component
VIDLRTLIPLDEELVFERVKAHGKCIVLTEEQLTTLLRKHLHTVFRKTAFKYLMLR